MVTVRATGHARYALAFGAAHLFPTFSAGPVIAALYRWAGFSIGEGTAFLGPVRILSGRGFTDNLDIGRDVVVSTDVTINVDGPVAIGDGASIGPFVRIYTATHQLGPGPRRMTPEPSGRPVSIGAGAWLRVGATVLPGVSIGEGTVIAAGSVVTRDIGPNVLAEGNPAVVVRTLRSDE
jgi:maltose O-acetyltransferase